MICLDANAVLELLLDRKLARACQDYIASTDDEIAITAVSVSIIMYYAEGKHLNLLEVERLLRDFVWLGIVEADVAWAFQYFAGKDFEDALQLAIANREGCRSFITLDKALAKKYASIMPIKLLG
ncbi:MAG: PIN domain-containing protein [Candidatus Saccharimonadales bacterium]